MSNQPIAEVIESCSTHIRAQCWQLEISPPLGSIVKIAGQPPSFALVCQINTQSLDPGRRPIAYAKTEDELRREQPQIFELLKTEFDALLLGHREGNNIIPVLPPQPPRIHSFIHLAEPEQVRELTAPPEYLRRLLSALPSGADELIVTCTRQFLKAHPDKNDFLLAVGKELAFLLADDYERLKSILRRISS